MSNLIAIIMIDMMQSFLFTLDRSIVVDPLSYFLVLLVPHDGCNKGYGVCCPVHIKESLAVNQKE